jgi:hypothetical protein
VSGNRGEGEKNEDGERQEMKRRMHMVTALFLAEEQESKLLSELPAEGVCATMNEVSSLAT